MADILNQIIDTKRNEVAALSNSFVHDNLINDADVAVASAPRPSLRQALLDSPTGIIAEFKRRSPSKGWINEHARPEIVPLAYQNNGAAAISILTDDHYFGGHDDYIRAAQHSGVTLPILYKNFIIDELQIHAAHVCGASAVLLIAACLTRQRCQALIAHAHALGLEVLLEMHSEAELDYAELGPDMCGINNRNLGSFVTDVDNSFRMAALLPPDAVKVSESGISDAATVRALRQAGFSGFLIGEHFMRAADPGLALHDFIQALDA